MIKTACCFREWCYFKLQLNPHPDPGSVKAKMIIGGPLSLLFVLVFLSNLSTGKKNGIYRSHFKLASDNLIARLFQNSTQRLAELVEMPINFAIGLKFSSSGSDCVVIKANLTRKTIIESTLHQPVLIKFCLKSRLSWFWLYLNPKLNKMWSNYTHDSSV